MTKHMLFHGIPVMNQPTDEQKELLRERDHCIGVPNCENASGATNLPPRPRLEAPDAIDPSAIDLLNKEVELSDISGGARLEVERHCRLIVPLNARHPYEYRCKL